MKSYRVGEIITGSIGLGNGVPVVEALNDKVRITFHLQKAMGMADRDEIYEIPYTDIGDLRLEPAVLTGMMWTIEKKRVLIPVREQTVVFVYENFLETYSGGWSEEEVAGPFLGQEAGKAVSL